VGTGFHPELSGRENIYLNGAILGMKRAEITRKFDEIVTFAEVEKFIDQPVKHFSSGMYMRLAFSVAAHLEPEILLVDEVLAVGDLAFQKKCLGKMENVAHAGRTILFISHNMAAVRALCTSAIYLNEGKVVAHGAVRDVIDSYLETMASDSGFAQIPTQAHRHHTGEVSIEQITLEDASGRPSAQLRPGADFRLRIRFELKQKVRQIRLGVGFNTLEGVRIATGHHTDGGAEPMEGGPGVYEISLKFTNPFLPGRYVISAGAHRALGGQTVDYVPEALRFEVLDLAAEGHSYQAYNSGLVRLGALWEAPQRVD
jgi:lipopolysaccharide transport system ATP-binding protein